MVTGSSPPVFMLMNPSVVEVREPNCPSFSPLFVLRICCFHNTVQSLEATDKDTLCFKSL